MSEWQPIETAPRDGVRILLAKFGTTTDTTGLEAGSREWQERFFDKDAPKRYDLWWAVSGFWSCRFQNWNDGVEPAGLADPSHWMRLPALPERKGE